MRNRLCLVIPYESILTASNSLRLADIALSASYFRTVLDKGKKVVLENRQREAIINLLQGSSDRYKKLRINQTDNEKNKFLDTEKAVEGLVLSVVLGKDFEIFFNYFLCL